MKRTSSSHPLKIDVVPVPGTKGQIGMTLCPGKVQSNALSGTWDRDLQTDLDVIEQWGADIMVSLMEPHEFKAVKVSQLPERASAKLMHYVLPIPDGGTPDATWEATWAKVGPGVRERLQKGGKVLIHCLGGLGRTGTLAARILIEFGMEPKKAMAAVRKAREGAIENKVQEAYVLAQKAISPETANKSLPRPYHRIDLAKASRYRGCLLGGAVGDALGAPVEFMDLKAIQSKFGPAGIWDYVPAYGRLGAITDDTQMTLFTAEGMLRAHVRGLVLGLCAMPCVMGNAYLRWLKTQGRQIRVPDFKLDGWLIGHQALFSARAPGNTCLSATSARKLLGDGEAAKNDSKGCGGIMRAAPVGLYTASRRLSEGDAFTWGCEIAALTHGHPTGQYPAGALAMLVHTLVESSSLREALARVKTELQRHPQHEETLAALQKAESLAVSPTSEPEALAKLGQGWVAEEALAISVFCALRAASLEEGIVMAVNITGDSDSTGAITGNLLGAMSGVHEIPDRWLAPLELREVILEMADDLATVNDWPLSEFPHNSEEKAREQDYWCKRYPGC